MTDASRAAADDFDLKIFEPPLVDDSGLSLEELSQAYADLLAKGDDPYEKAKLREPSAESSLPLDDDEEDVDGDGDDPDRPAGSSAACQISPQTIIEAMLFVGHPQNEPLTSQQIASFMRGVRPGEVDQVVRDLNAAYEAEGCAFRIESVGPGYRMNLREEFGSLRDRFYGRIKAARLSQAAIDVLAIIAYKQPLTRDEIDDLRGKTSGSILSQLVRRDLLRVERANTKPRTTRYWTTDRFLTLFGLDSLRDLPQSPD